MATACTRHTPASATELAVVTRLRDILSQPDNFTIARRLCGDGSVLGVLMLDAADRRMFAAHADLMAAEGKPSQRLNTGQGTVTMVLPRQMAVDLVSRNVVAWGRDNLDMLTRAPPIGTVVVMYDGAACGHGVFWLMDRFVTTPEVGVC